MTAVVDQTFLDTLLNLASSIGIFAGGVGILMWVLRLRVQQYFDERLQEHQNDLNKELQSYQSELDRKRQNYQNELEKSLQAFQSEIQKENIVFSDLHVKRAEVVDELYRKMNAFDEEMRALANPDFDRGDTSRDEKIESTGESVEDFRLYYREKKIYFPSNICESVEELLSESRSVYNDFQILRIHDHAETTVEDNTRRWRKDWEKLTEEEIPELRAQLEEYFRDLLGVNSEIPNFNVDTE